MHERAGLGIESLKEQVANEITTLPIDAMQCLANYRPLMQEQMFRYKQTAPKAVAREGFFSAHLAAEESLRQGVLRGLGELTVSAMTQFTIDNLTKAGKRNHTTSEPSSEADYGQRLLPAYDIFAKKAHEQLRNACESSLVAYEQNEHRMDEAFRDSSQRVSSLASRVLDVRLGRGWRKLDRQLAAHANPLYSNGRRINRHERHLMIKTDKMLSFQDSLQKATAVTVGTIARHAAFVDQALASAGYPRRALFPVLFANIDRLSFTARLPFWPAHDINQLDSSHENIFKADPTASGSGIISFTQKRFEDYYQKGIVGACQGIHRSSNPAIINDPARRQRAASLLSKIHEIAVLDDQPLPLDILQDTPDPYNLSSTQAASALVLSSMYAESA